MYLYGLCRQYKHVSVHNMNTRPVTESSQVIQPQAYSDHDDTASYKRTQEKT